MLRDGNVEYKRGIEDDLGDLFVLGFFLLKQLEGWSSLTEVGQTEVE